MNSSHLNIGAITEAGGAFHTTHWSVVLQAKQPPSALSDKALERLCTVYWPPLYRYIRRQGYSVADAKDLTQEFISQLLEKKWLERIEDQRGRFRSFLLTFLKHFLSDQRDRANALKRGGGCKLIPLDAFDAEERAGIEPSDNLTPDQEYSRRWARSVLMESAKRLETEYVSRGKAALFEQIKDLQPGEHGERTYAQIAASLGTTEQAIKNAVNTLRRRYGEILREEIAQTVADPRQLQEEIQDLMQLFR